MTSAVVWDSFCAKTDTEDLMPHALHEWTRSDPRIGDESYSNLVEIERSIEASTRTASTPSRAAGPSLTASSPFTQTRIIESVIRIVADPAAQTFKPESVAVVQLLRALSDPSWLTAPDPYISPTESGGLTAEFRTPRLEIQVESDRFGAVSVYLLDHLQRTEWEGSVDHVPGGIQAWASRLRV